MYRIIIKVLFIKILIEQVKEQRNFIWSLKRLKICVWRSASEETSLKKELLKTRHQKQGYHKHCIIRYFTRVDKVQCTKCTTTNSAHASATTISATCLYIKTRITVTMLQTLFRFNNGMDLKLVLHRTIIKSGKGSMVKNQSFKQDKLM